MKIKCFNFEYSIEELSRWKKGDKDLVPENVLKWLGPGMKNGLGYEEYCVTRYFKDMGYTVINNEYNLSTDNTKYKENNNIIKHILGDLNYNKLIKLFRTMENNEAEIIAQPDLFIFKENECMFIDVKRDIEKINPPQKRFAKLIKEELGIDFAIYNLQDKVKEDITEIDID